MRLATDADAYVELLLCTGDFIADGTIVAHIATDAPPATLADKIADCGIYGPNRTMDQDATYGLRLLADISIRALSPAVNDPTTAVQAIDQIEESLTLLAGRALGPCALLDDEGRCRVVYPAPDWPEFVALALDETICYGSDNVQVVRRMRMLLDRVGQAAPPQRHGPLAKRREALDRLSARLLPDPLFIDVAAIADPQGLGGATGDPPDAHR